MIIGHLYQWFAYGDHAPGNGGGVLIADLLLPAVNRRDDQCPAPPLA